MVHVVTSQKSVAEVAERLEEAVQAHGFGVLPVYDLKQKLNEKGIDFPRECRVLEVCNPKQAARVLESNMTVSLALPCRISVYEDGEGVKVGTLLPTGLLSVFPGPGELQPVAAQVEATLLEIIAEAR